MDVSNVSWTIGKNLLYNTSSFICPRAVGSAGACVCGDDGGKVTIDLTMKNFETPPA